MADLPQAAPLSPKTIYLIRHGVAKHNIPDASGNRPDIANDATLTDPPLVRQGILQAQVLGEHLRRRGIAVAADGMDVDSCDESVELVVCSPLTRCIQTASYIFPGHFQRQQLVNRHGDEMIDANGNRFASSGSQLVVLKEKCSVFCHQDVREAFGMHYPDKRSLLSHLKATFPSVTYHPEITEHDTAWSPHTRETYHDVIQRVHNFFHWLSHQPHNCVAVVSHGVWMECALKEYCPEVLEGGKKRVYNCDVYCGKLAMGSSGDGDRRVILKDVRQVSLHN